MEEMTIVELKALVYDLNVQQQQIQMQIQQTNQMIIQKTQQEQKPKIDSSQLKIAKPEME